MRCALVIPLLLLSEPALGDDKSSLLALSLEELLDIKVVTASKREESLLDAPGVVTVITAEDIKAFGARNLEDVLLRSPSYRSFDSYAFNATGASLRAGATQHINNHVLYLVNGRPLRESQNGGRQTDINLLFPLSAIARIEIIRGPGSVLYGSNAFNGTINLITKDPASGVHGDVAMVVGENGYQRLEASGGVQNSSGLEASAYINLLSEDGATITAYDDQRQLGSSELYRDGYFVKLDTSYRGFAAEVMVSEVKLPNIGGPFRWTGLDEWRHFREYINLSYKHNFGDDWSSTAHYTRNHAGMDVDTPQDAEFRSNGYLYELTVNGKINEQMDMVVGLVRDRVEGDLDIRGGRYSNDRNSVYGQLDYRFTPNTKVTAGFQWNKPEGLDSHIAPRLALIHKFSDRWTIKTLYAEAYRSPFGTEIGFDSGFLQGNPELEPETIETYELQVNRTGDDSTLAATFYQSKSNDLIGRRRIDNAAVFVNIDQEITYQGIELEGRWFITPQLQLQGNASYQETEDDQGHSDIMIGSNEMIKLGLAYTTESGITASIWNNYFAEVNKLEDLPESNTIVVNPKAKAVNLLSVNLRANLGALLDKPELQSTVLSVYADNLLDEEVWYPEMGQKSVNTYPQSHARGVYLQLSIGF